VTDHPKYITYRIGEEWEALYVDGKLEQYGDSYYVDERIRELLGVEFGESEYMKNRVENREDIPDSLNTLRALEAEVQLDLAKRADLRRKAEELRERAAELEEIANSTP
jgi:hypothetical protein